MNNIPSCDKQITDNLKQIRKSKRNLRNGLSPSQQILASEKLLKQLLLDEKFLQAKHIAFYKAFDGELNVDCVIEYCWANTKHCYLPKVNEGSKALSFFEFNKNDSLTNGSFTIKEVSNTETEAFATEKLELVIMPLVAFDKAGNRLGMGGGYYDFTFRHLQNATPRKTYLIGAAHVCQLSEELTTQDWDIKPDRIISV